MVVSSSATRLAGAGTATGPDAVREAVAGAIADLEASDPGLVIFFPAATADAAPLARAAAEAAHGVPIAGLSSGAQIAGSGVVTGGCSAIAFDRSMRVGVGVIDNASRAPRQAGREATRRALAQVDPAAGHPLLLLFLDPATDDQADTLAGAYEVAGARIPLAGGVGGGAAPVQFNGEGSHRDSVVAVAIVSPNPLGVGLAHGCRPVGVPAIVTAAHGRSVRQLDGRPAETVYLETIGRAGERLDDAAFAVLAVVHPLIQPDLNDDVRIRHVWGRASDGGLLCATRITANAAVQVAVESRAGIVSSASQAVGDALAGLGGMPARAALVFDCASRHWAADDATLELEVAAMAGRLAAPVCMAGGYTHGEVGRVRGATGDRSHAVVVATFA